MVNGSSFFFRVFNVYLVPPVTILGLISSSLSLVFFFRDTLAIVGTRLLLSAIAITDIGYLGSNCFYRIGQAFSPPNSTAWHLFHQSALPSVSFYVVNVTQMTRNWLVVLVAVERFLFFHRPMDFKRLWTSTTVALSIGTVLAFSLVIRIPVIVYTLEKANAAPIPRRVADTAFMAHLLTDCIVLSALPISLMIGFSAATAFQVRMISRRRDSLGVNDESSAESIKRSKRILSILKTILVIFIPFSLPSVPTTAFHFYCQYHATCNSPQMDTVKDALSSMTNFFCWIISMSNFFVYVVQSRRYCSILQQKLGVQRFVKCTT